MPGLSPRPCTLACTPAHGTRCRMPPGLSGLAGLLMLATSAAAQPATAPPVPAAALAEADAARLVETPTSAASVLADSTPAESAHRWQYAIGIKASVQDVGAPWRAASVRPMLGLRYGRWRIGSSTGENWLRHAGYLKDPNIEYEWLDTGRLRVGLSGRIQNLDDNAAFDGFGGGRNTLRARAHLGYRLTARWSLDAELTQDLLVRDDGATLSAGLSYLWPVGDRHTLGISAGLGWATGTHLQSRYRDLPPPPYGWNAGLASLGGGLSWRTQISPHWAWFASLSTNRTLGQLGRISPSTTLWGGQTGLLYFSR